VHPHLFRHHMLTFLTSKGLSDAQIQLISGHETKKSLEVYQHLSLESVDKAYQDAFGRLGSDLDAIANSVRVLVPLLEFNRGADYNMFNCRGRDDHR